MGNTGDGVLERNGATPHGGALCCDATPVSPLTRTGHPQPCTVTIDGAALRVAERRKHAAYPELAPQKLAVLGSEVGGRMRSVELGGTRLRPPAGASESPASPASHPRSGRGGLDTAMVEQAVRGGPTSGRQHSIGRPLAAAPAAGCLRGPAAGCSAAVDRPCWPQPLGLTKWTTLLGTHGHQRRIQLNTT